MATSACRSCKKEVASSAKICPHCGIHNPAVTTKEVFIGSAVLFAAVAVGVVMCTDSASDDAAKVAAAAAESKACKKDLACIGNKVVMHAGYVCKDSVERLAKNNVKWTDGTMDTKFSQFKWNNQEAGIVTFFGDKAQFQNGFGAYVNVIYACDIDVNSEPYRALDVRIDEGRL